MKYILIILLTISQCFAIEITPVKKGDPAPQDGFFVDAKNMKKFRKINEEKKLLESENLKLRDLSVVNEERIKLYKETITEYNKELGKERLKGNMKSIGAFILGVAATSLATYAAIKVVK